MQCVSEQCYNNSQQQSTVKHELISSDNKDVDWRGVITCYGIWYLISSWAAVLALERFFFHNTQDNIDYQLWLQLLSFASACGMMMARQLEHPCRTHADMVQHFRHQWSLASSSALNSWFDIVICVCACFRTNRTPRTLTIGFATLSAHT
jgi:hypothetical protein